MDITSTTVTRTAKHKSNGADYNIDYSTTDGHLDRIGLNIYRPPHDDQGEEYLGSVHYDGHNISCNLQWSDDLAALFETAVGFIAEVIEEAGDEPSEEIPANNNQR
jgi:hypothetical protein